MAGKLLLDTSAVVELFAGNAAVQRVLSGADEVFVPSIVLGELFYGAARSGRPEQNQAQVESFAAASMVLPCDTETARYYGAAKDRLRAKGRPLPENDIWVAATALQHGILLVARDAHFGEVENLPLLKW